MQEAFGSHGVNTTAETVSSLNGVGAKLWARKSRSTAAEKLAKLLPQLEPASILVETYFDRVHWFTLIFHQRNFRERFEALYHGLKHHSKSSSADLGFLGLLLAVFAVSLNHAGDRRTRALISYGMDPGRWKDEILTALKTSLLDIVALGSLEAVQTCILLGSYHLYQGEPELAWPLCGCGLRIAQALNLHRRMNTTSEASEHIDSIRRRCWWAVYEIETFCSMLYGFPLSISDPDCDVALLDAHDRFSTAVNGKLPGEITLLSYKCAMSELSLIIRGALTDLYGAGRVSIDKQAPSLKSTSGLQNLTKKVTNLDSKLQQWYDSLPIELRVHGIGTSGNLAPLLEPYESTSAQDKAFERHLFQIQAITLQFAFQNARILIHRPLLSYNKVPQSDQAGHNAAHPDNPVRTSINTCREAGLELSNLIAAPLFKEASNTYAAAFICVHLLTAGITLCIMSSFESLSKESHECKMGVRKIMEAQTLLVSKSIVAEQGLEVLKNLVTLMSKKELDKMLDFEISTDLGARDQQVQAHPGVAGESAMLLQNPTLNQSSTLLTRLSIPDESGAMAPYENANDDTFGLREGPWMAQALMDLGLGRTISYRHFYLHLSIQPRPSSQAKPVIALIKLIVHSDKRDLRYLGREAGRIRPSP